MIKHHTIHHRITILGDFRTEFLAQSPPILGDLGGRKDFCIQGSLRVEESGNAIGNFDEKSSECSRFLRSQLRVFTKIVTIIENKRMIIEKVRRLLIDPLSGLIDRIPIIENLMGIIEKVLMILKNGIPFSIFVSSGSIDQIPIIEKVLMIPVLIRTISVLRPIFSIGLAIILINRLIFAINGPILAINRPVDRTIEPISIDLLACSTLIIHINQEKILLIESDRLISQPIALENSL